MILERDALVQAIVPNARTKEQSSVTKKNPVQLKGVHTVQKDITGKNHNVAVNIILLIK